MTFKELIKTPTYEDFLKFSVKDIGRETDLGAKYNFNDVSTELNAIKSKLQHCIKAIELDDALSSYVHPIHNAISEYTEVAKRLFSYDSSNIDVYKDIRNSIRRYIDSVHKIDDKSKLLSIYAAINADQQKVSSALYDELSKIKKEYTDLIESFKKNVTKEAIIEQQNIFSSLSSNHGSRAFWWLVSSSFSFALLITIILIIVSFKPACITASANSLTGLEAPLSYYITLIIKLFKNLLLLSIPLVALKICLRKYNSERHLQIIYNHRIDVLKLHYYFNNDILSGDSRNLFILELTKFICSDPNTGYLEHDKEPIYPTIQVPGILGK